MVWNPSQEERSYKSNLSEMIDIYISKDLWGWIHLQVAEKEEAEEEEEEKRDILWLV